MSEIIKIIKYTKKFRLYYLYMAIFVIVIALLTQSGPIINKLIVDHIVARFEGKSVAVESIVILLVMFLVSELLVTALTAISQYIGDLFGVRLNNYLAKKYYHHVLHLPVEYYDNEITGKIVNKLERGISNITNLIQQSLNNFLPFFLSTFITLIIIGFYSIELSILLASLFPIYIWISHKSSKAWGQKEGQKNAIADVTQGRLFEAISSIRIVKSFIKEKIEYTFFGKKREEIFDLTKLQSREWHTYDFYRRLVLNFVMFGVFSYIIYFTFQKRFTLGEMTLLLQFANQARFPLFAMSFIIGQIQQAQAGSKDFFAVLETPISIVDREDAKELKHVKGIVSFNDVHFAYQKGGNVLEHISFTINKGEKLALVGESGEGKSTIANLLLRFYEPQKGIISIDGHDISAVTQESLRKNIGVVFQETFLFSGTIKDNILYGNPDANESQVEKVAQIANAHDFIMKLQNGYDTEVGERGVKLSGGQKQRIAIARALLKNPPILIFDEATSALDSKAEFEVQKALNKLMEGRTTLIIAHRLSTIRNVDQIIVLKKGEIAEQGSPKELEKNNGIYSELLSYQDVSKISDSKLKEFNIQAT
jgi:ATP-binding cassette subfamily B protein